MALGILPGQGRAEAPVPTPPASETGEDDGKAVGDSCVGCRKIRQAEVWRFERQQKTLGEWKFVYVRVAPTIYRD